MSRPEEPSQESVQTESESRVQGNVNDEEDDKDEDVQGKDFLRTRQREQRTISPLTLLKEDFSQFKEDVLKVFRDKDTRTEPEDRSSTQTENRANISALALLREDLSHFKEEVSSIFSGGSSQDKDLKSTDPQSSQAAEKTINPLSLLKDDLSNVFRISVSKEKDKVLAAKEDSSKIKVQKGERMDDPFRNLFRRDQRVKETLSEKSEEQMDKGFKEKGLKQKKEMKDYEKGNTMKDKVKEAEDSEVDINLSEETSLCETQQCEETTCRSHRADSCQLSEEDKRIKEEEASRETLLSRISRFSLRDDTDDTRDQTGGDPWWVKNFACYLTFDPSTANSELHLTNSNRRAIRMWSDHRSSEHPDRFERCPQVLCREGLLDSVYWEVDWSGGADIGVTSNSISRHGNVASCLLGHNEWSWSLECSEGSYTPCYNNKRFRSSSPQPFTYRVGVYLNWSAGSLSFYCISQDAMVHLHTFTSTFTEPLYPGFWVWAYDGSVSLCQVELDWERQLQ